MRALRAVVPILIAVAGVAALAAWLSLPAPVSVQKRVPVEETRGRQAAMGQGVFTLGTGSSADIPGVWPRFRGANFDNISTESIPLAERWPAGGPKVLWSVPMGEGFAGAAVWNGRVYVLDYDRKRQADSLLCLSLADGEEIWRYRYGMVVRRNHGMSRTVPAVTDKYVVTLGPKCHVLCVDPNRGSFRWAIDLVKDYGTKVPDWYAGQCPLIDGGRAIIAPAGEAMMIAVNCADGNVIWRTPNPKGWRMSHSSVVPMEFAGRKMYVYCANEGVVGVDSRDGRILWQTPEATNREQARRTAAWRIKPTVVPTPVLLGGGRIFLSGGYGAGCKMLQLKQADGRITPELLFYLPPEVFGAKQQTPIFYQGHLYGMRPNGNMVCMDPEGNVLWSGGQFGDGYGPYVIAGGLLYVMDDDGVLTLLRATPTGYQQLDRAKVLEGPDSWGPMVVVAGRLIARDLNRMICLDIRAK